MTIDPSAQAFTAQGIYRAGVAVTFTRLTGFTPNVTTTTASVTAIIRSVAPDTTAPAQDGMSASKPGAINQDQRLVIVMVSDLTAAGFPLPLLVGDKILVAMTNEQLNVDRVDPYKRASAGAIELYASAVA